MREKIIVMRMTSLSLLLLLQMYRGMKLSDKSDLKIVKREITFFDGGNTDSLMTVVALRLKDDLKKQVFCSGNILSKNIHRHSG